MVHVHIDGVQLAVGTGDKIITPGHHRAHFFQYVSKTDIALHAVAANTRHFYRTAFDRASGKEIGGGGSITFNQVVARGLILLRSTHHEALI